MYGKSRNRYVLCLSGCVACGLLLRIVGSLPVDRVDRPCWATACQHSPPRQLRLRGGLPADMPHGDKNCSESGLETGTVDEDGPACLPWCQKGEPYSSLGPASVRREDTRIAEMAAADAFERDEVIYGPDGTARYAWDATRRTWLLFRSPDEDLSIESLQGSWDFAPSECLTFRHRKPDKWQHVDWAPGVLGWIEFFFFITPVLNQLLYIWRGLFSCAVCGQARSQHPCKSEDDADEAFWQAVRFRDIELAVRLVRGGVGCDPGGPNWCLLVRACVCIYTRGSVQCVRAGVCACACTRLAPARCCTIVPDAPHSRVEGWNSPRSHG